MHLLFCGDAREFLAQHTFSVQPVHLVVTSPPYNLKTNYDGYDDDLSYDAYWQFTQEWLTLCYKALIPSGRIAVNLPLGTRPFGNCFFPNLYALMRQVGFLDLTTIVWVKQFADTGKLICPHQLYGSVASAKSPYFRDACELILVMQKPGDGFPMPRPSDLTEAEYADWTTSVWRIETEKDRIVHPAPFPLQLPYRLIKLLTVPGQVVIDPFLGSGTTLKACELLGRKCISCELSPQYIRVAWQRVRTAKLMVITRGDLPPNGGKPTQKPLFTAPVPWIPPAKTRSSNTSSLATTKSWRWLHNTRWNCEPASSH